MCKTLLLQSEDEEHLQFPGSSKPDFILFLRFKFGLCEKEAITVFDRLQADRAVGVTEGTVEVNQEMVRSKIAELDQSSMIIKIETLDPVVTADLLSIADELITSADNMIPTPEEFKSAADESKTADDVIDGQIESEDVKPKRKSSARGTTEVMCLMYD